MIKKKMTRTSEINRIIKFWLILVFKRNEKVQEFPVYSIPQRINIIEIIRKMSSNRFDYNYLCIRHQWISHQTLHIPTSTL